MTDTGTAGHGGDHAVRLVVGELSLEIDSVTNLSMEGRNVKDRQRRAGNATLRAVRWMGTGALMVAGAPAVKNVEEEQRLDDGLALNQKMEAEDAREMMKTGISVTANPVVVPSW